MSQPTKTAMRLLRSRGVAISTVDPGDLAMFRPMAARREGEEAVIVSTQCGLLGGRDPYKWRVPFGVDGRYQPAHGCRKSQPDRWVPPWPQTDTHMTPIYSDGADPGSAPTTATRYIAIAHDRTVYRASHSTAVGRNGAHEADTETTMPRWTPGCQVSCPIRHRSVRAASCPQAP
jgi:hypothetical protein